MTPNAQEIVDECCRQSENCEYTALSFTIWLRRLRWIQAICLTMPVVFGGIATWNLANREAPEWAAVCTLLATVIPVAYRASKLDNKVRLYTKGAAVFTNLRDRFRQAANISIYKESAVFEKEVQRLFDRMDKAREAALTPPEWCFIAAKQKIDAGHMLHDHDEHKAQPER